MLGLGTGFYGVSGDMDVKGSWLPSDESSLEAWYRFNTGITDPGGRVSAWANSAGNSDYNMLQSDGNRSPTNSSGTITFSDDTTGANLEDQLEIDTAGGADDIELDGAFVIGMKFNSTGTNMVIMGSNQSSNEMIKLQASTTFRLKNNDGGLKDFTLSSGATTDDSYWVISRDGSDNITVYKDGSSSPFVANGLSRDGTFIIDAIGVRNSNPSGGAGTNNFDGTIKEIVIFKGTTSAALIANVNDRLSNL
jgi:hypothetical protein